MKKKSKYTPEQDAALKALLKANAKLAKIKHTDGPWQSEFDADLGTIVTGMREGRPCLIAQGLYDEDNEPTLAEIEANGRLMASAPDMLAMLHENLSAWEGEEDSVRSEHRELILRLKAVIKGAL